MKSDIFRAGFRYRKMEKKKSHDGKQRYPPVSGSEAELHCSIAAAVWSGTPSDSYVLIFATVRGEKQKCLKHVVVNTH